MQVEGPVSAVEAECERVLRSLPAWFGIEESLLEYARGTAHHPTFVIRKMEQVAAFVSLRMHFEHSWEVYCIAVRAECRGKGYGKALMRHAEHWLAGRGVKFLQVKTIAPSHTSPEYAQTRAFYVSQGFVPHEVFPDLWSPRHPCLQMIKTLTGGG